MTRYLAEQFISKVSDYTPCGIHIMDDKGIIAADTDAARVGNFHEIAYRMACDFTSEQIVYESDRYAGTEPGIYLAVHHAGSLAGIIGISGDPEKLRNTAHILKLLLEEMLDCEDPRSRSLTKKSSLAAFLELLCSPPQDSGRRESFYARQLHYEAALRIPILIRAQVSDLPEVCTELLTASPLYSSQDILFAQSDFQIIIFKTFPGTFEKLLREYHNYTEEYLSPILHELSAQKISFKICVGSFQNEWKYYHYGYRHCIWMIDNLTECNTILYFYNYVDQYMNSLISFRELHGMFNVYFSQTTDDFKSSFTSIMDALIQHNYNLSDASRAMFIHKNTLVTRFGKIRDFLNISPFHNYRDKELCKYLMNYLLRLQQY